MPSIRCDEVIVQINVRTYDEQGQPLKEQLSQPVKFFRASGDIWPQVDAAVQQMQQQAHASAGRMAAGSDNHVTGLMR